MSGLRRRRSDEGAVAGDTGPALDSGNRRLGPPVIRTAFRVILAVLTIGALFALGLLLALNLGGASWATNQLLRRVNPYPGTTMRVGSVTGNFLTGIEVRDARMTDPKG